MNTNSQKSRLHRGKRFWSWALSLSHTARFFLRRKGWGQSAQRDKVTRAVGAAGSGTVGMPPTGWGTGERKTPEKPSWGFVTRLGAAAPPGQSPPGPGGQLGPLGAAWPAVPRCPRRDVRAAGWRGPAGRVQALPEIPVPCTTGRVLLFNSSQTSGTPFPLSLPRGDSPAALHKTTRTGNLIPGGFLGISPTRKMLFWGGGKGSFRKAHRCSQTPQPLSCLSPPRCWQLTLLLTTCRGFD